VTGKLITLEGGEGAGKSTLAQGLRVALAAKGRDVVVTREPGGSAGADEIRAILLSGGPDHWSPLADALLVCAARTDHLERTVAPALKRGAWVICDRFTDSTRAYQGAGRGLDMKTLAALEALVNVPTPDLTFVLDIDPDAGVGRSKSARAGEDRFERFDAAFHARVRQAFLEIARANPKRCVVLDATQSKERVLGAALDSLDARLG
jgi:dTMP kinase